MKNWPLLLRKKDKGMVKLKCQMDEVRVAQVFVYQCDYDPSWNKVGNHYIWEAAKDKAEAFHEDQLACLKEVGVTP